MTFKMGKIIFADHGKVHWITLDKKVVFENLASDSKKAI